jgi:hypothetical protein
VSALWSTIHNTGHKENAKHTLRAMKENARQGFWNGSLPPIGYRIVEAAEQRGHRTKKTLEIDPIHAETVRLIFRLAREGDGTSGPMGVKSITTHLNAAGIHTRDGGRGGVGAVHNVLTRMTYIGRHKFNTRFWKTRERKPDADVVEMAVPPSSRRPSSRRCKPSSRPAVRRLLLPVLPVVPLCSRASASARPAARR